MFALVKHIAKVIRCEIFHRNDILYRAEGEWVMYECEKCKDHWYAPRHHKIRGRRK